MRCGVNGVVNGVPVTKGLRCKVMRKLGPLYNVDREEKKELEFG